MANASEKKIHAQNSTILFRLRIGFLLVTTVYWGFASLKHHHHQRLSNHLLPYCLSTALSLGCWRILSNISEAAFDAKGRLKGVGADLQTSGGIIEFLLDFIYGTWIVQVLVALSNWKVWWVLYAVLILVACIWKLRNSLCKSSQVN
jgi:hypothetical protein